MQVPFRINYIKFIRFPADLSEYNMLLHNGKLVVIDVSQSVEHDHPHSLEFLRMDIGNVTRFFKERGARVLGMKRLFEVLSQFFFIIMIYHLSPLLIR